MAKKIFITRKIPDIGINMLLSKGYIVDIYKKDKILDQKELIKTLKKGSYDAVLCLLTDKIQASVFDACPTVKLYANYATGFDNIDVVEATRRGITVTNAPGDLSSDAVAQHTVALLFTLANRIIEADSFVRQGKYKGWAPLNFIGTDLANKTLGLIGAGRIGEKVAQYTKGLNLRIIYNDVKRNEHIEKECGAKYCEKVDDLLREADIVSLHVPLMDSTLHLINESRLLMMRPTSFIINTSRGPVIDEEALVKALKNKTIAGAGLDVFEFEPKLSKGLAKLPNVVLTPHIASASSGARNQMATIVAENIVDFFEGKTPQNKVNK